MKNSALARTISFAAHAIAVYSCVLYVSPWLVGRWFAWVLPLTGATTYTTSGDWYLQHLELASILPALVVGYAARSIGPKVAQWAWTVPALVLSYKLAQFHVPHSVLIGNSMSAFRYYFEIARVMPNRDNFLALDSGRVLAQMLVTAPFYSGVAYSLGAWAASAKLLERFFRSRDTNEPEVALDPE